MKLTDEQKRLITIYGHLIVNIGGNDIVELCEREDINLFSITPMALLQSCVQAQVLLLTALSNNGELK